MSKPVDAAPLNTQVNSQASVPPDSKPKTPKSFLDQETSFRGQYSKDVFRTLYLAYKPFFLGVGILLLLGFLGRILMLANANIIGFWVDELCKNTGAIQCHPVPAVFSGFSNKDFLYTLIAMTATGFVFTAFYRVIFSRISAAAVSRLYDEVTLRTSRQPIQFFDQNPVGRIVTRFSSDYGNVFRLFGGPLAEFFA
ncbi:MAG: hypothetical protein EOP05_15645, partial [Proteobacteria bacterium]